MRLTKETIGKLSKRITRRLLNSDMLIWDDTPEKLQGIISTIITDDLMVEDQLNEEVKMLLEARTEDYERSMMDYGRVFQLVKTKLARDRGLIL
ncbi:MAG: hypothetical protein COV66_13980 [Nitrospinae bacterium CG11_big_fil_rev_8_21_14_0_20_45_15]|nr:MAG: hypothetical protein COV66_13980 [Nitrospinae bacterium CG11_big_fil_rev_8_21_14_0_20_45_15]